MLRRSWTSVVIVARVVVFAILAVVGGLATAVGAAAEWLVRRLLPQDSDVARRVKDWAGAAGSRVRGMLADLWRFFRAGYRVPDEGTKPVDDLWCTPEFRESLVMADERGWVLVWVGLVLREFLRKGAALLGEATRWLVLLTQYVARELRESGSERRESVREGGEDWTFRVLPDVPKKSVEPEGRSPRRPRKRLADDPYFWLFLQVLVGALALTIFLSLLSPT